MRNNFTRSVNKNTTTWGRFLVTGTLLLAGFIAFGGLTDSSLADESSFANDPTAICVNVFQDYNSNGVDDGTAEPPISSVIVTAYDSDNVASVFTVAADGSYTFTPGDTDTYRVEVTGLSDDLEPSVAGATTTFFASANTTVNVALHVPEEYYPSTEVFLTVPCYVDGPSNGPNQGLDVLLAVPATSISPGIGNPSPTEYFIASHRQIGSTFGVAYSRPANTLFASAFLKRHTAFGPGGTGAIYQIALNGNQPTAPISNGGTSVLVDLNALFGPNTTGMNPHPDVGTNFDLDPLTYPQVGKVGLGGLAHDGLTNTLWTINLADRRLYEIPLGGDFENPTSPAASDISIWPATGDLTDLPGLPGTAAERDVNIRPFAVKYHRGEIYIGIVSTAESTVVTSGDELVNAGDRSQMEGFIYRFDPDTDQFTQVLTIPFDYARGQGADFCSNNGQAEFNPWVPIFDADDFLSITMGTSSGGASFPAERVYPQPWITDLEFDETGKMLIGVRDRFADQHGYNQQPPNTGTPTINNGNNGRFTADGAGDILVASINLNDNSTYVLESNSGNGANGAPFGPTVGINKFEGPGNGEFFFDDRYRPANAGIDGPTPPAPNCNDVNDQDPILDPQREQGHDEISLGGLFNYNGQNALLFSAYDPLNDFNFFNNAGFVSLNNQDGSRIGAAQVYVTTPTNDATFAKGNGLGDVHGIAGPAPIQIGNRVWLDANSNGRQDTDEDGINGVLLELYKETSPGTFTKVAETMTRADGNQGDGAYLFSSNANINQSWEPGFTQVEPDMNYEVRVSLASLQSQDPMITAFTVQDAQGDATNNRKTDLSDSDATPAGVIAVTTGRAGQNNHTLDIGAASILMCDLTINSATPSSPCNPLTNTYNLDVSITYTAAPIGEPIILVTEDGNIRPVIPASISGTETFTLFNLPSNGNLNIDLNATFSVSTTCTNELSDAYDAPLSCALPLQPCVDGPGIIGGLAFLDSNNNGAIDGDDGQIGVDVTIYDCDGAIVCTTITDENGAWFCDGLTDNEEYRVEFSHAALPNLRPGIAGADNGTGTQSITAPACGVNFGLLNLNAFCDQDPFVVTSCYLAGNIDGEALVAFPLSRTGDLDGIVGGTYTGGNPSQTAGYQSPVPLATNNQIGTTYGSDYDQGTRTIYLGSYARRKAKFGGLSGESTGAIYQLVDPINGGGPSVFADLNAIFGANVAGDNPHPAATTNWDQDTDTRDLIGKISLGDVELSADKETLYTVNMFDRQLYALPTTGPLTPATITRVPIPTNIPGCAAVDIRPMALGVNPATGVLHVGAVCSAESTQDVSQLRALIWTFDGTDFTLVMNESLNYGRFFDPFNPWSSTDDVASHAEPMLSDIEFDGDNALVLGIRDRHGDKTPADDLLPGQPPFPRGHGDILRACRTPGAAIFNLESNGSCSTDGPTAGANRNFGPGGGEYYFGDDFSSDGDDFNPDQSSIGETAAGGLLLIPGSNQVISTAFNPNGLTDARVDIDDVSDINGVSVFDNVTGDLVGSYAVFDATAANTFGKTNGLGDLVAFCEAPAIQIGNYVWIDSDEDGVQDACEPPVTNLPVTLYTKDDDGTLTEVTNTLTDAASGEYYFDNVIADTTYLIVFGDTPAVGDTTFSFNNTRFAVAQLNTGEGTNPGLNDSDASFQDSPLGILPAICYRTADSTDHSLDVGLVQTSVFDLALVKRLNPTTNPGPYTGSSTVDFTVTVYNQGDTDATDIEVKDYLPTGMSLAPSSASDWTVSVDTAILATPFALAAGSDSVLNISFVVDADFMGDTLVNRAEISSFDDDNDPSTEAPVDEDSTPNDNGLDEAEADTPDEFDDDGAGTPGTEDNPLDEDDYDWEGIPVTQSFDLNLVMRVDTAVTPEPFTLGDTVAYKIEVRNQGSIDATNVTVANFLADGLTLVPSAEWALDVDTARSVVPLNVAAGDTACLFIAFEIDLDFEGDSILNRAEIATAENPLRLPDEDSSPGDNGSDEPEVDTDDEDDDDGVNGNGIPDNPFDEDDFDFARLSIQTVSLGSTVFLDYNNDGFQNGPDTGIPMIEVQLWDATTMVQVLTDADGARITDPADAAMVVTDPDGNYIFDNLIPGDYFVVLPTAPAAAPISSNNAGISFLETDPDDNLDNDDEGLQAGGSGTSVTSGIVRVALGDEPENGAAAGAETGQGREQDDPFDSNGNMTLDFGFFAPVSVGDTAFVDLDGDGLQTPGEPGIAGVTVNLLDENGDAVTEDADGMAITGLTTTDVDGSYSFGNLPPGVYSVVFDISTADNAEFYDFTSPNAGSDAADSDNSTSLTADRAQSDPTAFLNSGEQDLTLDVGLICAIEVVVAPPFTICSTQPIVLNEGASINPSTLGGTWSTPDGTGTFTTGMDFAMATTYVPSRADARRGSVTLILTSNDPEGTCEAVSNSVEIQILKVDCGAFFWDGQ